SMESLVDHARLISHLGPDGRLMHRFRFQVWNWKEPELLLLLHPGAQLLAAKADGRWVESPTAPGQGGMIVVRMPVVVGKMLHRYEVIYTSELRHWKLWATLDAPVPQLPMIPLAFRRTWRLPPGVAPLAESSLVRLPAGADEEWFQQSWFSTATDEW